MSSGMFQGLSLNMSQRQEMVMTPQMIQAMEMLQLPLMALEQRISQELMSNPALELAEMQGESNATEDFSSEPTEISDTAGEYDNNDLRKVDAVDIDWDNCYDDCGPRTRHGYGEDDDEFDIIENSSAPGISLYDHLENQLGYMGLNPRQVRICTRIIHNLDRRGYLEMPLADTADPEELPAPDQDELERMLRLVQALDPAGVGARDLAECLLLQLDDMGSAYEFERELIEKHLDDIAANRLPIIARSMKEPVEIIKECIDIIRNLDPTPGLQFSEQAALAVQADVIVEVDDSDNWTLRLSSGTQPEISEVFLALFDTTAYGKALREKYESDPERAEEFKLMREILRRGEEGKQLREKYQSARWLITAIAQRERTLYRVSLEILDAQKDYLAGRIQAPAPLMMQEIADRVNIDRSTVSRAVKGKYMLTPIGLKPLREFFTRAVGGASAGKAENSNAQIMDRIKVFIDAENKSKPLKDDQLLALLVKEGIDIQRRTVAKYRNNLGYASHSKRREY